jgi:DNA invertase Pin-like site-specific DNA recombinase
MQVNEIKGTETGFTGLRKTVVKNKPDMKNKENKSACLFVRVSTDKQEYERQIRDLSEYCNQKGLVVVKTIVTKITGTKTTKERPDLQELFDAADKGLFKKVIVTEVSRIGRNARDIRNTIDYLHKRKISITFKNIGGLESLDENGNESFVTNVIIAIYSELAQEEKRILSDRICSGLANAKAKGKHIGRRAGSYMDKSNLLKKYSGLAIDLKNGLSLRKSMKIHVVSKGTVLKVKRALN